MMEKKSLIISLCSFTLGIWGIRFRNVYIIASAIMILFIYYFFIFRGYQLALLAILLSFSLPLSNQGYLFGIDSHYAASQSHAILIQGWPLPIMSPFKSIATNFPFLYLQSIATSLVTSTPLRPSSDPNLVITNLLPAFYAIFTLFLSYIIAKNHRNQIGKKAPVLLIPLLWIPLYRIYSTFQRRSIAILLFTLLAFFLFKKMDTNRIRIDILSVIVLTGLVLSNHLAGLGVVLLCVSFLVAELIYEGASSRTSLWYIFVPIVYISWIVIGGFGLRLFVSIASSLFVFDIEGILSLIGVTSNQKQTLQQYQITANMITDFRVRWSKWLFQGLIAMGVLFLFSNKKQENIHRISQPQFVVFLFGFLIAICTVTTTILQIDIYSPRLFTFLVVISSGVVFSGYEKIQEKTSYNMTRIFIVALLITSASMIPLHLISQTSPNYTQGEYSRTLEPELHATASFTDRFIHTGVWIGDNRVEAAIYSTTGHELHGYHDVILSGKIPKGSRVFLQEYNSKLYINDYRKADFRSISINPNNPQPKFDIYNNRVYSNNHSKIYL